MKGKRKETWKALEHLDNSKQVRAIGVAGLIGAVAIMMINHRLFASTHHFDATLETVASKVGTAARN